MGTNEENSNNYGNFLFKNGLVDQNFKNSQTAELLLSDLDEIFDTLEDSPLIIRADHEDQETYVQTEFHCHKARKSISSDSGKKLIAVAVLCFIFIIVELIGGYLAGSLAIMTDAAHLFSDLIGFCISILAIWISKWPPSNSMTFGYYRAEVLGAFLSVVTIWVLEGIFCIMAIHRLCTLEFDIKADTMLIVASLGVIINVLMGAVLHGTCLTHSHILNRHQHSHNDSINVRAAAAHVIGDLLQSVGVLIAAILIKIFPSWKVADPVCTIIFALVALCVTFNVAKDSIYLLLEANTKNSSELALELRHLKGVKHLHSLHLWALAPDKDAVAVHLAVDENCDREYTLKEATELVHSKLNIVSCTIQIESYNSRLIHDCSECRVMF